MKDAKDLTLRQKSSYGYVIFGKTARGRAWVREQLLEFQTLPLQIAVISLPTWRARVIEAGLTFTEEPFTNAGS